MVKKLKRHARAMLRALNGYWGIVQAFSAIRGIKSNLSDSASDTIALQVDSFDKGGLEEVVLMLARNLRRCGSQNVLIIVSGDTIGHLGSVAASAGIPVVALWQNKMLLRYLISSLGIKLVNLHYSVFGIDVYARASIPIVYTVHNTYIWADANFVKNRQEAYRNVSRYIAVSRAVKDYFVSRFAIDPNLVITIPNGLDLEYVAVEDPINRESLGFSQQDIIFLNVATFNWVKFQVVLLEAMEQLASSHPEIRLVIVGNEHGPDCRRFIVSEIARRGLEGRVKILDYVPKGRVIGLMNMADCFVLPSLIEGWSIAVMEAMYCALPLILSDVGSARDVIESNDIGIIIGNPYPDIFQLSPEVIAERFAGVSHLDNAPELISAMVTIASDIDGWKRRAGIGRRKIENEMTAVHMCQKYIECYSDVMECRRSSDDPK